MTRTTLAVVRWRLAVNLRSLRFLPPAVVLLAFLAIVFAVGPQNPGSCTATSAVCLFALAVWIGLVHDRSLGAGARDLTVVAAGRRADLAGEALSGLTIVVAAAALMVLWPVATGVLQPKVGAVDALAAWIIVSACGAAGLAVASVVDASGLGGAARFVLALGAVTMTLGRTALEGDGPLGRIAAWCLPPVMDTAQQVSKGFPGPLGVWLGATVLTVVWALAALAMAGVAAWYLPRAEI